MLYGRRAVTTAGLTWGYYGGTVMAGGVPTQVANGTIALTPSATNYVEANPATGAVSANTTGFTPGRSPLYQIITDTGSVTSYADLRVLGGSSSAPVTSVNGHTGAVALTASDVGADAAGAASDAIAAHDAATDPHPQYLTQTEGDARYAASAAAGVTSVNGHTGAVTLAAADVGAVPTSALGAANGAAQLGSDQKLLPAQLPDLGIVDFLGTVASQTAMLALTGQKGDWCIRSDDGKVYTITGSNPTQAASWTAMSYPVGNGGTVTSVDLSVPGLLYTVSGNPVTSSGTLTFALKTQAANTFLAGPTSGSAAAPTMRTISGADLPVMGASGSGHAAGAVPDPGSTAGTTKYLREDGSWQVPTGSGTPGGSTTQVQFNDGGAFAGASSLTWDKTNNVLIVGSIATPGIIRGATNSINSKGGSLTIKGGDSTGGTSNAAAGGDTIIASGAPGHSAAPAGAITIKPSDGASANLAPVLIQGGTSTNSIDGGALTLAGGTSGPGGTAAGGAVTIQGGASSSGTNNSSSGSVIIKTQVAQLGGATGAITIQTADAPTASFGNGPAAAAVSIIAGKGGNATTNWNGAAGGNVTFTAGTGGNGSGSGGPGVGGDVKLTAGTAGTGGTGNANGGNVTLTPGAGVGTGARGNVVLNGVGAALATNASGGFICIPTCAGTPTGTPANVPTGTAPVVWDSTNLRLMTYSGSAWNTVGNSGSSSTLSGDSDVAITSPSDGQVLTYDAASSKWKNKTAGGSKYYVHPPTTTLFSTSHADAASPGTVSYDAQCGYVLDKKTFGATNTDSTAFRGKTVPSGTYTAVCKLNFQTRGAQYVRLGMALSNGSTVFGIIATPGGVGAASTTFTLAVQAYGLTSFVGNKTLTDTAYFCNGQDVYFRIRDDGTNVYFDYSLDGGYWISVYSEARTATITPTHIGLINENYNTNTGGGGGYVSCSYWSDPDFAA